MRRSLPVLLAAVVAVGVLWSWGGDHLVPVGAATIAAAPAPLRIGGAAYTEWLPALREGADVTFSRNISGKTEDPSTPGIALKTLGPLAPADLDEVILRMQDRAQQRTADLQEMPTNAEPGVTFTVLQQAEMLCEIEESLAAAEGLRRGDYFVTASGKRPPGPPDAGLVQTSAWQNGKSVLVSIVLPFAQYTRFADAYSYRREMYFLYPAAAADYWNRQAPAWRKDATARFLSTSSSSGSAADRAWRRQFAPNGTVVDAGTCLMAVAH